MRHTLPRLVTVLIEHLERWPREACGLPEGLRSSALEHARYRVEVGVHHQGSTLRFCIVEPRRFELLTWS